MSNFLPIFKSHFSYGRSILTLDDEDEIKPDASTSIFAICAKHELRELYLIDSSAGGLVAAYKTAKKNNISLRFGYEVICCSDMLDRSDESERTESKVIVWLKSGEFYPDFCSFYTKCNTVGYYKKARCDYRALNELNPDAFYISIPFYDSFLHKNILEQGKCVPDFYGDVYFHIEDHSLPFDPILARSVRKYVEDHPNYKMLDSHTVLYYAKADSEAYQAFRCIDRRSKFSKPELDHFGSDEFSFESYIHRLSAPKS